MVGIIYEQAYDTEDWFLLIGLVVGIVFTAKYTIVYVNYAIKYYD